MYNFFFLLNEVEFIISHCIVTSSLTNSRPRFERVSRREGEGRDVCVCVASPSLQPSCHIDFPVRERHPASATQMKRDSDSLPQPICVRLFCDFHPFLVIVNVVCVLLCYRSGYAKYILFYCVALVRRRMLDSIVFVYILSQNFLPSACFKKDSIPVFLQPEDVFMFSKASIMLLPRWKRRPMPYGMMALLQDHCK